jgi:hypothetical protein
MVEIHHQDGVDTDLTKETCESPHLYCNHRLETSVPTNKINLTEIIISTDYF